MKKYSSCSAVLLEDHKMFAEAFALLLERLDFFESVSIFNAEAAVRALFLQKRDKPVYFFLDYYIPGCNVLFLMADVRRLFPDIKIIMLSSVSNEILIKKILLQKPMAFISKSASISEIIDCIDCIERKEMYISPDISTLLQGNPDDKAHINFTPKELELLVYIAQGRNITQTADLLQLSPHTVIAHRRNMMKKANCHSVIELLAVARTAGLLIMPE